MAQRLSPDCSNLCSSLPKPDVAAPLSDEKPAGDSPPHGADSATNAVGPTSPTEEGAEQLGKGFSDEWGLEG